MVEKTQQHKKTYKYSYAQFTHKIKLLAKAIQKEDKKFTGIYAIPRGGYIPAVVLSHILFLPLVDKVSKDTIVVDDILDTGKTLQKYKNNKCIVLVCKPKGIHLLPNVLYQTVVNNNCWVVFWWEDI